MKKILTLLLTISCIIPIAGFTQSHDNDDQDITSESQGQTQIVLGAQLDNPYSVINMRAAFDFYNEVVSNSPFRNKTISATHQYIQINPATESQLEELDIIDASQDNSIILHDYPLDHEILEEGDYYVYPQDEADLFHPVYSVVPMSFQLPFSAPYIVLENLYEPSEEEYDVETVALVFAGWEEDANCKAGRHCTDINQLIELLNAPSNERERLFGGRYRPHGYVQIENTETNNTEPLRQAKISIGRSIWWRYTDTDDNGHFVSPKKYRGKVRIRAKWRSNVATIRKSWNELLGIQVSDHLMTITRGSNGRTKHIFRNGSGNSEHVWYKGTVHNGLIKYNDYALANGISVPIVGANVWAWKNGSGDGVTLMLNRYRNLHQMAALIGTGEFVLWDILISGFIGLVPGHLRPDQLYTGLKKRNQVTGQVNTAEIEQLVFHETAHYSHAEQAGAWFWANLGAAVLGNQIGQNGEPYADGVHPSPSAGQQIALAEGWATFVEFKAMDHYYNKAEDRDLWQNPAAYIENFDMFTVPMLFQTHADEHWFLNGLFWDVHDQGTDSTTRLRNGQTNAIEGNIVDNLHIQEQGEFYPVFSSLKSDIYTACDFGAELVSRYPQGQDIEDLFHSYGYTCVDGSGGTIGIDPTTPPGIPYNFTITTFTQGLNRLDWSPMAQTDYYDIHASANASSGFSLEHTVNTPARSWIANVTSDTYFKVKACNIIGCSDFTPARLAYYQQCGNPPLPPCE